ncbi:hypothetical protein CONPUDRAFT_74395 [Coniophora puteana RWD-64-598 SS2]|uniref:DUF6533 domain-containing protein n=1 Tax=Coniophora puteana (strain RWD-64-598) TaxID=741705 RepID=A0A5M3MHW1_CONPW|nr:uncharacterized protein CONPUDRAFT_74395 [Coniophora puteana RWD-64-598 SS2]EIW78792.1 hypothetical protein CONPUDRAFT_74395 [Coniophora puteana RWD-64-598 SS2]
MSSTSIDQELALWAAESLLEEYAMVAASALVYYDYLSNLSLEIDLIWTKKLSWATVVYAICEAEKLGSITQLRYLGLAIPAKKIVDIALVFNHTTMPPSGRLPLYMGSTSNMRYRQYVSSARNDDPTSMTNEFAGIGLPGLYFCDIGFPPSLGWINPASSSVLIVYEGVLCGLVLWYASRHLWEAFCRSPGRAANTLASVILRDNLIYFFLALLSMFLSALNQVPSITVSLAYNCLDDIFQTFLFSMVGPWMVISLRKSYERSLSEGDSQAYELSTVAFTSAIRQPEHGFASVQDGKCAVIDKL